MDPRVLHLLSQRPSLTGSGVTLEALVRHADQAGWDQCVAIGVPAEDPHPAVGELPPWRVHPVVFESDWLPFPVPGMSDVMPYRSSRWSALSPDQLATYREVWSRHIAALVATFQPDVIHSHHLWLMSSILADVAPRVPVVNQSHATGLRQMRLCGADLAAEVRRGCARNARFVVLHEGHRDAVVEALAVPVDRVTVVGAGFREDVFHATGRAAPAEPSLLYAGKYSRAKGLPWLLDAVARLAKSRPGLRLHVAGAGAGEEADALRARMEGMAPTVVLHGQVDQARLAALMRATDVFVLPSFYEGLPLVLVEALACGDRLVCTALSGVERHLAPHLGATLDLVPLPRLVGPDEPVAADLPAFVDALTTTLAAALEQPPLGAAPPERLAPFTWGAVFSRVERVWREAMAG